MWLSNKYFLAHNIITSAALWSLWKLRNEFCFQNASWRDVRGVLMRIVSTAQNWLILCLEGAKDMLSHKLSNLKVIVTRLERISGWRKICLWIWCASGGAMVGAGKQQCPTKIWSGASTDKTFWWKDMSLRWKFRELSPGLKLFWLSDYIDPVVWLDGARMFLLLCLYC